MSDKIPDRIDVLFHGDDDGPRLSDDDKALSLEGYVLALATTIATLEDVPGEERTAARFLETLDASAAIVIDGAIDEQGVNLSAGIGWLCQFTRERFMQVTDARRGARTH